MELARRTRWIALSLPVALAAVAMLVRASPPGVLAAAGTIAEPTCASPAAGDPARGAANGGAPAWYRLDPVLDASGTLAGQHLVVGRGSSRWTADLPAESFATGPVHGRVLVGDDDGHRSRLRVLDTIHGCWAPARMDAGAVIRSAVLTPDGSAVFEHRVDRWTRQDLGVWRRDVAAPGVTARVLPGLTADGAYGPTFTTTLEPAADGRVVASSCGLAACRIRVLDPTTGAVVRIDTGGPAVGVAHGGLVAMASCDALPCPLSVVDLDTRHEAGVGEATGPAVIGDDGRLVVATANGLEVSDTSAPDVHTRVQGAGSLAPLQRNSTSTSGIEAPRGTVALAPGGRLTDPSLVRFLDPASLLLTAAEVLP